MYDLRRHMRPVTLALGLLAGGLMGISGGFAQTPVGTTIRNEAMGRFIYKSGESDSIRSNSAEVVVTPAVATLTLDLRPGRVIVRRNEILQYTLRYRNTGNGPADGLSAVDSLPPQVVFVYASRGGQFDGQRVVWSALGNLQPGVEDSLVVSVRIRGDLMPPDSVIVDRARIQAVNAQTALDSAVVFVHFDTSSGIPWLEATKIVDNTSARPGMTLRYALQVINSGNAVASGLTVVDSLPPNTTFVSATAGGTIENGAVIWRPDTLWVNESFGADVTIRIDQNCPSGYLDNLAHLFADGTRTVVAGPARTLVSSALATSISIGLSSDDVPGNGMDSVQICATVRDGSGNVVGDGTPVVLKTTDGLFNNLQDSVVVFTSGGVACVSLKSPVVAGKTVRASVVGVTVGANGTPINGTATIDFYPAAISGMVVSASGETPISGAVARIYDMLGQLVASDTTRIGGRYLIPIEVSGAYSCVVTAVNRFGDPVTATFHTSIKVPATGGMPPASMLSAISGVLLDRTTGRPIREGEIRLDVEQIDQQKTSGGRSLPTRMHTDGGGAFLIDSLGAGIYEINVRTSTYTGTRVVADTLQNAFIIDANISLDGIPGFEITKSVNKRIAEIGDAATYTLEIRNMGTTGAIARVRVIDLLPKAFVYASGSARINGKVLADPKGTRRLEWSLPDTLKAGQMLRLSYMVTLGAAALESDGINRAYAVGRVGASDSVRTPEASVQLIVRPGVFTDRGIVIGKVFYDSNENGRQDVGEKGIHGVELWMEDGTHITTGDDGKYSLPEVISGQHVMRINSRTLPAGALPIAHGSEFAGDGVSRFIRLTESGIARADFFVQGPNQAGLEACLVNDHADPTGQRKLAIYMMRWRQVGKAESIVLQDTLPQGWHYFVDSNTVRPATASIQLLGDPARAFRATLPAGKAGVSDVIRIAVLPDSTVAQEIAAAIGSLVLTYPSRRDAIIDGKPLSVPMEYVDMLIARSDVGRGVTQRVGPEVGPAQKLPAIVAVPSKPEVSETKVQQQRTDSIKIEKSLAQKVESTTRTGIQIEKPTTIGTQRESAVAQQVIPTGRIPVPEPMIVRTRPVDSSLTAPVAAPTATPDAVKKPEIAMHNGESKETPVVEKAVHDLTAENRGAEEQGSKAETQVDSLKKFAEELSLQANEYPESIDSLDAHPRSGGEIVFWILPEVVLLAGLAYLAHWYVKRKTARRLRQ